MPSLVVNVASHCGFTDCHYTSLMKLSQSYLGEKLNIILFPCNQFGNQEPGTMEEIQAFIRSNYPGDYILFNKVDVVGENADPVFDFLSDSADKEPTWNFWKYLVASDGTVIDGWGPWVSVEDIEQYLVAATQMSSRDEL
ncbi:Glutathione peroxidase 7 [Holothuria leucospilota]|uniref:Glutathione peroxidase n=1 Tax=Holothuria leucospilota TaxID=206669 RepID=A0A9Q1C8H3_HOLLE|nr:Glutathione peroxidase 7 [Holothuria leucospilota]